VLGLEDLLREMRPGYYATRAPAPERVDAAASPVADDTAGGVSRNGEQAAGEVPASAAA
jgi:hypothetical protein